MTGRNSTTLPIAVQGMLHAETILPEQIPGNYRRVSSPERRLLVAILQDFINLLLKPYKTKEERRDAWRDRFWLESSQETPFSFLYICQILGIEGKGLRQELLSQLHATHEEISPAGQPTRRKRMRVISGRRTMNPITHQAKKPRRDARLEVSPERSVP